MEVLLLSSIHVNVTECEEAALPARWEGTHEGNPLTLQSVVQNCIITACNTGQGNRIKPVKSIRRKYISVHCSLISVTEGSPALSASSGQESNKDRWRNCAHCHFVHFRRHTD